MIAVESLMVGYELLTHKVTIEVFGDAGKLPMLDIQLVGGF